MQCSGAMTPLHDPSLGTEEVDIGLFQPRRLIRMCPPCRDAAGRMGMLERRDLTHTRRRTDPGPQPPGLSPIRAEGSTQ